MSLFVFVDALGWALARRHGAFRSLLPCQAPLETVFGYSSACDPTILTGVLPREHGHFSFFRYRPAGSPFGGLDRLDHLPRWFTSRARVRRLVSRMVQRRLGYTGYFQLYNLPFRYLPLMEYSERRDLYEPGGINGGQATVFDRFRGRGLPFHRSDWRRGEPDNVAAAARALEAGQVRVVYLYLAGLDGVMHAHGTRHAAVGERIRWYEAELARLVTLAERRYGEVEVALFSDHGMTDVTGTCDLARQVAATGLRFGRDYAAVYDSTMARFWFLRPGAREGIVAALAAEPRGVILGDEELTRLGCDFPDRAYGDLFFLLHPGVLLSPSHMGERPVAGMHGYHPSHPDSTAFFASNRQPDAMPARLADLHHYMLHSAGVVAA